LGIDGWRKILVIPLPSIKLNDYVCIIFDFYNNFSSILITIIRRIIAKINEKIIIGISNL
jgi:hypothetical protein